MNVPARRTRKRRHTSLSEHDLSGVPDTTRTNSTPTQANTTLPRLSAESSVRELREAFGLEPDTVVNLPLLRDRLDEDMDWEQMPRRQPLVRFALKLTSTICSILYPANSEKLLVQLGEEIRRSYGGTTADVKSLVKVAECIKECNEILPRDSLQRAAMLAPACFGLSNVQARHVCMGQYRHAHRPNIAPIDAWNL